MDFIKHILSRGLPKTGQTTQYVAGDDGTYEAGWWVKRFNANNYTRFVTKTIGGDVIVFDRATGLHWAADGNAIINNSGAEIAWADAIAYPIGKTHAGFSDWRVPNLKELLSIGNYEKQTPAIDEPPFINTGSVVYWCSTTFKPATTLAWEIDFDAALVAWGDKALTERIRCVRGGI